MDDFKDERFTGIIKDPRFKKITSKHKKLNLDRRIHGMFSDKRFNLGCKVDKRGSPLDCKVTKDYQKLYQQDEGESESFSDDEENPARDLDEERGSNGVPSNVKAGRDLAGGEDDDHTKDAYEESDDGAEDVKIGSSLEKFPQIDESDGENGSTSTDTEMSDTEQEEEIDHHWQELDADAPRAANVTRRLAVCNMDWDRLRAEDFLVVFNSFKPADGVIHSIKIYPSEFGLERMEKEKLNGPAELINSKKLVSPEDKTNGSQDSHFHREKLRKYQINRLKYFFAVVDCDSPQTADSLYDDLNGMEFESSGCILDLRFIPDDMTFDQEPASVASSVSSLEDYKPTFFVTSALNQIKVDFTWDETDPRRKEVLEKAFTDPESIEKDLKEYLASPSESEDETELEDIADGKKLSSKEAIARYRTLLQTLEEKERGEGNEEEFDMEITWDSGLKEKTEKLVKEKALKETLTPFEEKLQKRKELKKMKKEKVTLENEEDHINSSEGSDSEDITGDEIQEKVRSAFKEKNKMKSKENPEVDQKKLAELALLVAEADEKDSSDSDGTESQRKKEKKKKKKKVNVKKEVSSEGFVDDPRFAAMYTSHLYHVDPAEQKFKEKKEMQAFIEAAQRKKYGDSGSTVTSFDASKKGTDFAEGLKGKKSVKIEALKEKLTPFCREFQKKKELKFFSEKLAGQSPQKVSFGDDISANESALNSSASAYIDDDDESNILIFSTGSAKKRVLTFSPESPHSTNSIRKKLKKNNVP